MTTRRSPDGQVYTEVPVVPRHDQLDGRSLGNSHPIEAITGLQDALDGKVDAVEGKELSEEDYTTEEKAKLDGIEEGAEANRVAVVKVNGAALTPDADRAVDVEVPSGYGTEISVAGAVLTMAKGDGSVSEAVIGDPYVGASNTYNPTTHLNIITLTKRSGARSAILINAEDGAEKNVIEQVRVNGHYGPVVGKVESISMDCGTALDYDATTGRLELVDESGAVLDHVDLPINGVEGAEYLPGSQTLRITLSDGSQVDVDLSDLATEYTAGNGLRLTDGAFALTDAVATAVSEASDHVATDSVHVSAADRTKWNGVDNAVKVTGDQTVAGAKTFTGTVVVPTPQAASQAATKAYVDSVAGGGGGGGGGTYTAGTGLTLEGTEFSLSTETQSTLSAVSGKASDDAVVKLTGDQTVAGIKTFSSLPVIPTTTPTSNGQAASKKYVDDSVSGKAADTAVVHNTGAETVAGVKTFSSIPVIPTDTPTQNGQVASKAYVDAAVAGGGGGGGGTSYTAGTGLQLVGTEFSLDSATQTAVGAVSSKADDSAVVKLTGDQTVAGVKTFSSSPVVPTPTTDYQAATKKYVDDNAGGGGGTWTTVGTDEYTTTTWNTLFSGTTGTVTALKDMMFYCRAYYGTSTNDSTYISAYIPKGSSIVVGNLVGTSLTASNKVTFNFRPNGLFDVTTTTPVMAIEKLASSATAWTVTYPTVTVTKVNEPYKALTSGFASGKCTVCVQYR